MTLPAPPLTRLTLLAEFADREGKLTTFPDALAKAAEAQAAAGTGAATAKEDLAQLQAELMLLVAGETNPIGKPAFGNDAARAAEVRKRLTESPAAHGLQTRLAVAERDRQAATIEVKRLEDEFRVQRALLEATQAKTALLCWGG
jgi:hypothetical protein